MKKVVHYIGTPANVGVGKQAILFPIDHPDSDMVSNTKPVLTTSIVHVDKGTGRIETQNTIYLPADGEKEDVWKQAQFK